MKSLLEPSLVKAGCFLENLAKRIEGLVQQNIALERLNQELRAIDQMKSDFVSNVSHELRTPLASIKGFAATIIDDSEMLFDVVCEFVGIINDESDKLIVIINDLLDVSKWDVRAYGLSFRKCTHGEGANGCCQPSKNTSKSEDLSWSL